MQTDNQRVVFFTGAIFNLVSARASESGTESDVSYWAQG
jgi:hypothetical protein